MQSNGFNLKPLNFQEKPVYKLLDKQGNEIKIDTLSHISTYIQRELSLKGDKRNSTRIYGDLFRTIARKNNFVGGFRVELVKDKGV